MSLNCFLLANSPFVLGCWWMVTDKDSDNQMKYIIEESVKEIKEAR